MKGAQEERKRWGKERINREGGKRRTTDKGTTEGRRGRKEEGNGKRKEWGKGIGARG